MGKTAKEKGREIRSEGRRDLRGEAVLNVVPKKGHWLVNTERKRCYGRVVRINRDGSILSTSWYGGTCRHEPGRLYNGGYEYHDAMPRGEGWTYGVDGAWLDEAPASWPYLKARTSDGVKITVLADEAPAPELVPVRVPVKSKCNKRRRKPRPRPLRIPRGMPGAKKVHLPC